MSRVAKVTIGLMIATMLSKILGFFREVVLASYYGASSYSDAYLTAYSIPSVLFSMVAAAISTTFIPLYYDNDSINGRESSLKFTNNILNLVIVTTIIISIIGVILTEPIVKLFAIGFEGETLNLTINFTKIMIFGIISLGISDIVSAYLRVNDDILISGLIGIPLNLVIILSIIVSSKGNIYILPIGTFFAMASQFIFQIPFAKKKGYKYSKKIDLKDEYIKKMIFLIVPVLIGVAVNQVNTMIDKSLASTLQEGSISSLNYANRLNNFVMAMFITSIGTVIYPKLSKLSFKDKLDEFKENVVSSIRVIILIIIPISVGAMVLSKPIVRILFERGEFTEQSTYMTSSALIFYSIGMIGFGLRDILGKVFYSLQDTKTPMINGVISVVLNIILNVFLVKYMGHAGLAFATSISSIICIILLFNKLSKKIGYFKQDEILIVSLKSLVSSIIMGILTFIVYTNLNKSMEILFIGEILSLILSVSIGVIVYIILLIMLKVKEINLIIDIIKDKISIYKSKL